MDMNSFSLKGKVAWITGASYGIGFAIAEAYAAAGATIVFNDINQELVDRGLKAYAEKGIDAKGYVCDVTSEEAVQALVQKIETEIGVIDILVNNAGISMRAMFKDLDLDVIRSLMDVNFWGTVQCTKYALPYLLESKGQVVGVISIAGFSALPARTGYSASKYAVRGFLDTVRIEHLKDGLNVLVFAPGYTESNVRKAALTADGTPQGETPLKEDKLMSAEECARHLAKGLEKRKSQVVLTGLGKATVLAHNLFPRLTDKLTYGYIAKETGSPFK